MTAPANAMRLDLQVHRADHNRRTLVFLATTTVVTLAVAWAQSIPAADLSPVVRQVLEIFIGHDAPAWARVLYAVMAIFFVCGLADLWLVRLRRIRRLAAGVGQVAKADRETLAEAIEVAYAGGASPLAPEVVPILVRLSKRYREDAAALIDRGSISVLDLLLHRVEMNYQMVRFFVWAIPSLGFLGTVAGISSALIAAQDLPDLLDSEAVGLWFNAMTSELGIAFYTTLCALVYSILLTLNQNVVQGREEHAVSAAVQVAYDVAA